MEKEKQFCEQESSNKTENIIIPTKEETKKALFGEDIYAISHEVINTKLDSDQPFSIQEISEEIEKKGGIRRTSICVTIKMYIEDLRDRGWLKFDLESEKYRTTDIFKNKFKKQ